MNAHLREQSGKTVASPWETTEAELNIAILPLKGGLEYDSHLSVGLTVYPARWMLSH